MGANAQTTVPTFTAGQVLTADQQNQSARTGVPVFATTVERDAAFGGSGEKTLAEGQLCYLESTDVVQYYDGASWATVGPSTAGALTLISSTTIGSAVATITVSSAFSSTYDNYKIIVSGGAASTDINLTLVLGATTTGYYAGYNAYTFGGSSGSNADNNAASWTRIGAATANGLNSTFDLMAPNLAKNTFIAGFTAYPDTSTGLARAYAGVLANTTQYTAFTLATSTGTVTGGTIKVYGYQN